MPNTGLALKYPIIAAAVAALLVGCGSGGNGTTQQDADPRTAEALFVNSPVQGLTVEQDGRVTTTGADGAFPYDPEGGDITFRVGALTLGSAPPPTGATQRVTPYDLGPEERAVNVAQFLQTLDDPSGGINVSGFADVFIEDGVLQFDLPATIFETQLTAVLVQLPSLELRNRQDAASALEQGTSVEFSEGDFGQKLFYFEVVGTDALDEKGFIAFDGPDFGTLDAFSDFSANGGTGAGPDFMWEIDSAGRLVLEIEGDEEQLVLSRIFRVEDSEVTRFRAGAPGDDPVDLYQSLPFTAEMLEGNRFDVVVDGEIGWVDFETETFKFESDPTPLPFEWEIRSDRFGVLQIESAEDTTWFVRFRDLSDEGFEAFYLDVEPASDGSEDVSIIDGGWVNFESPSASGNGSSSNGSPPTVFEGTSVANNRPQEGGVDTEELGVFCGHEYDDGERVSFRVVLNPGAGSFGYTLTFDEGSQLVANGDFNSTTGQLSHSTWSVEQLSPDFESESTTEFDALLSSNSILGQYEATTITIYIPDDGSEEIEASCTSVFDLTLSATD